MPNDFPSAMDWPELCATVECYRRSHADIDPVWRAVEKRQLTVAGIDELVAQGWRVKLDRVDSWCTAERYVEQGRPRMIGLYENAQFFQRDKELLHELCHAFYGDVTADGFGANLKFPHNALVDWLARQWRAEPALLRHAVRSFGLQPQVYDRSSYEAFIGHPDIFTQQRSFPFFDLSGYAITQMDETGRDYAQKKAA